MTDRIAERAQVKVGASRIMGCPKAWAQGLQRPCSDAQVLIRPGNPIERVCSAPDCEMHVSARTC
jgi:hypothetical protein